MAMTWLDFLPIVVAFLAGWAGNELGKSPLVGGDLPMNKAVAPAAAAIAAATCVQFTAQLRGIPMSPEEITAAGLRAWAYAALMWTTTKNLLQLIKAIYTSRRASKVTDG